MNSNNKFPAFPVYNAPPMYSNSASAVLVSDPYAELYSQPPPTARKVSQTNDFSSGQLGKVDDIFKPKRRNRRKLIGVAVAVIVVIGIGMGAAFFTLDKLGLTNGKDENAGNSNNNGNNPRSENATNAPTGSGSTQTTNAPTDSQVVVTSSPTKFPTPLPTTRAPTPQPTTRAPTPQPTTRAPTSFPTSFPTTRAPTNNPTRFPTPQGQITNSPIDDGDGCPGVTLNKEVRANPNDYVGVIFMACPSAAAFQAFTNAAARWSRVVVQNNINPQTITSNFDSDDLCGSNFLEGLVQFQAPFVINHLIVLAETIDIDGRGGVLAQAGPCFLRGSFPAFGGMQFDNADLLSLENDGTLQDVILHEMGHVLGLGTLWEQRGLLIDAVFPRTGGIFPDNDPKFIGAQGIAQFNAAGGTTNFVPVEDDGNGRFDASQGQGRGSIDGHWDIAVFNTELMVFAISNRVNIHPLSRVTIAALADAGYGVSFAEADNFVVPTARAANNLRGEKDDDELVYLDNDIRWSKALGNVIDEQELLKRISRKVTKEKVLEEN